MRLAAAPADSHPGVAVAPAFAAPAAAPARWCRCRPRTPGKTCAAIWILRNCSRSMIYSLVMNSSRLSSTRLNSTHAAASACGTPSSRFGNSAPTVLRMLRCRSRLEFDRNTCPCARPRARRLAAQRQLKRVTQPVAETARPLPAHHAGRQRLRRLEEHRVVQQVERLQRRVRTLAPRARQVRIRAHRSSSAADTASCAGSECTARGGSGPARALRPTSPTPRTKARPRPPAAAASRCGRRRADPAAPPPAPRRESAPPADAGATAAPAAYCPDRASFSSGRAFDVCRYVADVTISRTICFMLQPRSHELRSPANRAAPDATAGRPAFRNPPTCRTMPRPNISCHMRFTATRAVSGFSGDISHRASVSRVRLRARGQRRQHRQRARLHLRRRARASRPARGCRFSAASSFSSSTGA